jgi:hypothetical protein
MHSGAAALYADVIVVSWSRYGATTAGDPDTTNRRLLSKGDPAGATGHKEPMQRACRE